jgi:hypothetical protein
VYFYGLLYAGLGILVANRPKADDDNITILVADMELFPDLVAS